MSRKLRKGLVGPIQHCYWLPKR